ncbi:uncharacterized protein Dvar_82830 [Desulfosarcina variabilis str. Montpellier]|uniref:caspase family protein n=1 Tax=Desulfosarcina variabilis TaxID=2300 RepID=UPI003AFA7CDA
MKGRGFFVAVAAIVFVVITNSSCGLSYAGERFARSGRSISVSTKQASSGARHDLRARQTGTVRVKTMVNRKHLKNVHIKHNIDQSLVATYSRNDQMLKIWNKRYGKLISEYKVQDGPGMAIFALKGAVYIQTTRALYRIDIHKDSITQIFSVHGTLSSGFVITGRYIVMIDCSPRGRSLWLVYDYEQGKKKEIRQVVGLRSNAASIIDVGYQNNRYYLLEGHFQGRVSPGDNCEETQEWQGLPEYRCSDNIAHMFDSRFNPIGTMRVRSFDGKKYFHSVEVSRSDNFTRSVRDKYCSNLSVQRERIDPDKYRKPSAFKLEVGRSLDRDQRTFFVSKGTAGAKRKLITTNGWIGAASADIFEPELVDEKNRVAVLVRDLTYEHMFYVLDLDGKLLGSTAPLKGIYPIQRKRRGPLVGSGGVVMMDGYLLLINDNEGAIVSYNLKRQKRAMVRELPVDKEMRPENTFRYDGMLADVMRKGNSLIAYTTNGTKKIFDLGSGRLLANRYEIGRNASVTVTPEGYFAGTGRFNEYIHYVRGLAPIDFNQLYDVFYRPDLVDRKLSGEDIRPLVTLTVQDALSSPPPRIEIMGAPTRTSKKKVEFQYKISSTGGGIGEVRVFHNGKLIQSDGFYRDLAKVGQGKPVKLASLTADVITRQLRGVTVALEKGSLVQTHPKGNSFIGKVGIDVVSGENEVGIAAFNASNTVQSEIRTTRIYADVPREDARIFIMAVGIDKYRDRASTLRYAVKDAEDLLARLSSKVATVFGAEKVHVYRLLDNDATKQGILATLIKIGAKIRPVDRFVLFIASHGVLNQGVYSIVTHDYPGYIDGDCLIRSDEIMDVSKKLKALEQLFIFDTCHAGGVNNLFSGLYDARMTVLAKSMGLHMYTSASSTQEALDGYKGNGLFTHAVMTGLQNKADINRDGKVTVTELGSFSRDLTVRIGKKIGYTQTPLIVNFGSDSLLYRTR